MTADQMFRLAEQFQPPKGPDRSAPATCEHP